MLLRRIWAYCLDCLLAFTAIMLLLQGAILSPIRPFFGIETSWFQDSGNLALYVWTTISLPIWLYFILFESSSWQGTPGKRWLGLRVGKLPDAKRLTLWEALLRTGCKLLPWELAHLGVIFPTPMYFEENPSTRAFTWIGLGLMMLYVGSLVVRSPRRCLYDYVLGTAVVRA